ncbi:hypothetical protein [Maribacter thermophilus]|uniref:hypothetical protein n=1 Tax=Maribacter thermophilus TaxID=1197874 RepID=UPI00064130A3|nr:hypothetical protein [Maribacter thermophilus]
MKLFFNAISYIFHPIFIPIYGTVAYFLSTPKYTPLEAQSGNILPIFILTIIIPIVSYLILRNLGVVKSIFLSSIQERKYPIYIYITLLLLVLLKVIPNNYIAELYFFFVGLTGAAFACLILLFFNFKTSLHLIGVSSLFMYLITLSIHFEINLLMGICLFALILGLVASSRIYLKAHTRPELVIGLLIGLLSQLLTVRFWL